MFFIEVPLYVVFDSRRWIFRKRFRDRMVRPERIELPTSWFVAMRSIQLSYGRISEEFASMNYSGNRFASANFVVIFEIPETLCAAALSQMPRWSNELPLLTELPEKSLLSSPA
jgi:hypothetical protein